MALNVNLRVIVEDSASRENPNLLARHGLSLFVEATLDDFNKLTIMVDTGPSGRILLDNMQLMGLRPKDIDLIVISHGHYDHTGGLIGILRSIGKHTPVVAHPKAFDLKLKTRPFLKYIGSPHRPSRIKMAGGIILFNRSPVALVDNISTSGEIDRITAFEDVDGFWTVNKGKLIRDEILDDQALFIRIKDKGLAIIAGCAHAGIVNTVKYVQRVMNTEKVYAIIGGFHLSNVGSGRIEATVRGLTELAPEVVCPCHCTGLKATSELVEVLGDRCIPMRTGDVLRL